MKVNRILSNDEVDEIVRAAGREPQLREGDVVRNRVAGVDGFISNAEAAVNAIQMEKATPQQWLKMIEGKGGLKAGEDKWIGLSDWLEASDRKTLTKQEVLEYINQNKIQIDDVAYTDADNIPMGGDNEWNQIVEQRYGRDVFSAFRFYPGDGGTSTEFVDEDVAADVYRRLQHDYDYDYQIVTPNEGQPYSRLDMYWMKQIAERIADYGDGQMRIKYGRTIHPTRITYTTDGLSNKREIALTVPTIEPWNQQDNIHFGDAGEGRAIAWARFGDAFVDEEVVVKPEDKAELERLNKKVKDAFDKADKEPSDENRDAFLAARDERDAFAGRTNARGGIRRRRVLFIDEIQSKRHQDAREKGYASEELKKLEKEYDEFVDEIAKKHGVEVETLDDVATSEEKQRAADYNNRISELRKQGGVTPQQEGAVQAGPDLHRAHTERQ